MRGLRALLPALLLLVLSLPAAAITPNDPLFDQQWGFTSVGLPGAWNYSFGGSAGVKVAVIDDGLNYGISDFQGSNLDLANAWDYWDNDATVTTQGHHGTHVTGTIAQATNNDIGAAGAAFATTVLPLKVFPDQPDAELDSAAFTAAVTKALRKAVAWGADVINLSIGLTVSQDFLDALGQAYAAGTLVVAAAGNDSKGPDNWLNATPPADLAHVLPVGALGRDLALASFSQLPTGQSGYGVVAPGVGILQMTQNGAESLDGTSMASPLVAGVAALGLSYAVQNGLDLPGKGSARVDWLRSLLTGTAQDLGAPGVDSLYGYGMVRADTALALLDQQLQEKKRQENAGH